MIDEWLSDPDERVALVGIGSELRGDDALGMAVARRLSDVEAERALVVEGGVAPENHTGVLRQFDPTLVILIDAVEFGGDPGDVKPIDPADLQSSSFSSHKSTPAMLMTFIEREIGADVRLLGIQPASVTLGADPSGAVSDRIDEVVAAFRDALADE